MRVKKLTLTALALAAGLSLTACQGNEDSAADTSGSGASSSSSAAASGDSGTSDQSAAASGHDATASESAQGSGNGQVTTGTCMTSNLEFGTAHGMGEGDLLVSLKNTGDACTLKGFPGVDLRSQDASGPLSAERSELDAPVVDLGNGETTRFTLHYPPNNTGGSGVYVTAIEVTPPDETHSKALSVDLRLPVGADGDGDGGVVVDPVGTGKQ
ncbi:DUF4232 domain-containing protein [Streptomyces sp. SM10]|uniref:DUF4232 domain-containing protein n=1 Tax=Streptomyces sp. SM10 TaxID=565556 RepID=UPI000CDAD015|nr:DUF4232 domain-containing protein [Streptomyces sp. SM10]